MAQLAHFTAALALGYCGVFGGHATAQEAMPPVPGARPEAISIELSAAEDIGAACKLSFVVTNSHGQDIDKAVYEMVLFDAAGQVSRLTLLDFQDLPAGRLRVRQFQFPQPCADISRVLINGAQTCTAAGLDVGGCSQGLTLTSRTKMELLG